MYPAASALLVGALLVGSSLAQQPTAAATESVVRAIGSPAIEAKLSGFQLPTLDFSE
ncbi:MAG: hypothetical protein LH471_03745 [Salinibacterium sp.]|nr:hypothetical protein [Salinibacterium sp.]